MRLFGHEIRIFGGGMHRVQFVPPFVRGRDVLDIGVVQHTPEATELGNWLRGHIRTAAHSCIGKQFDVIVAGDIVEHLHDVRSSKVSSCT